VGDTTVPDNSVVSPTSGDNLMQTWTLINERGVIPSCGRRCVFFRAWGDELKGREQENWIEDLEALMETFIEYEQAFRFTENNGYLRSSFELRLMNQWEKRGWEKRGRPEWTNMEVPESQVDSLIQRIRAWWERYRFR